MRKLASFLMMMRVACANCGVPVWWWQDHSCEDAISEPLVEFHVDSVPATLPGHCGTRLVVKKAA